LPSSFATVRTSFWGNFQAKMTLCPTSWNFEPLSPTLVLSVYAKAAGNARLFLRREGWKSGWKTTIFLEIIAFVPSAFQFPEKQKSNRHNILCRLLSERKM